MNKQKILILCGGDSQEYEISLKSGKEVEKNLDKNKYESLLLIAPKNEIFPIEKILKFSPDFVFIAMHGGSGEDGTVQKILKENNISFLGSGVKASRIGMDKIIFHKLMEENNVLMPAYQVIDKSKKLDNFNAFNFPIVSKPYNQGSSIGVSICNNISDLQRSTNEIFTISDKIILEKYIKGMEISCGVIGNNSLTVLPIAQIVPKKSFFDYQAKYDPDFCDEIIPAKISEEISNKIKETATNVFLLVGCKGLARIDMIICDNIIYVLEINTLPGLTENSIFPKQAKAMGINYTELLTRLIELGKEN